MESLIDLIAIQTALLSDKIDELDNDVILNFINRVYVNKDSKFYLLNLLERLGNVFYNSDLASSEIKNIIINFLNKVFSLDKVNTFTDDEKNIFYTLYLATLLQENVIVKHSDLVFIQQLANRITLVLNKFINYKEKDSIYYSLYRLKFNLLSYNNALMVANVKSINYQDMQKLINELKIDNENYEEWIKVVGNKA